MATELNGDKNYDYKLIHSIHKGDKYHLLYHAKSWKGIGFVDIRAWYESKGKLLPSRKGIAINYNKWNEFLDGINITTKKLIEFGAINKEESVEV